MKMKVHRWVMLLGAFGASGCSSLEFTHVPPGQSAMAAKAKQPEVVATPAPAAGVTAAPAPVPASDGLAASVPETELPQSRPVPQTASDFYMLGTTCLQEGKNSDAVLALEKAVQLDPAFAQAWNSLAISYQNVGQPEQAKEAFRRYKALSLQ
jgi:tetratricopeptide (TPR) repeat protein